MMIVMTVEVEVEHRNGKFISKDELRDSIMQDTLLPALASESVYVDDSEYEIVGAEDVA